MKKASDHILSQKQMMASTFTGPFAIDAKRPKLLVETGKHINETKTIQNVANRTNVSFF
jgi:hypothetical protein